MTATFESRKLRLLDILSELNDEAILLQIENLLLPGVDFWDDLSAGEKGSIRRGIEQLDRGERIEYESFMSTLA